MLNRCFSPNNEDHASAPSSRFKDEPVARNEESSKNPLRIRLELPNASKHEEEVSIDLLSPNSEEIFEDSSMSENDEIDNNAGNSENCDSKDRPICKVCGKSFHSIKALYGHMRLHSKKGAKKEAIPSCSSEVLPDLSHELHDLKWFPTGRRGRKRKEAIDTLCGSAVNAANILLHMGSGLKDSTQIENTNGESTNPYPGSENPTGFEGSTQNAIELEASSNDGNVGNSSTRAKGKSIVDSSDPIGGEKSYRCGICNKSFSSYQALGGHKVSHKKGKSILWEGGEMGEIKKQKGRNHTGCAMALVSEYVCNTCGKKFPTGQALGGHMRAHYEPPNNDHAASSLGCDKKETGKDSVPSSSRSVMEASSSRSVKEETGKYSAASSSGNVKEETVHFRDFNLNKPPKDTDECI